MLKVGITGGIGSGKSIVCQVFATLGIPVFNADDAAKYLMNHDETIKEQLIEVFGKEIYREAVLQKEALASIVFTQKDKLTKLNAIIHPATIAYGEKWMTSQNTAYAIKEAALFFESGSNKKMDFIIGVFAPEELRIKRAMQRDGASKEKVLARIARQMNEEEKMKLCDEVIVNDDQQAVIPQVLALHNKLLKCATNFPAKGVLQ